MANLKKKRSKPYTPILVLRRYVSFFLSRRQFFFSYVQKSYSDFYEYTRFPGSKRSAIILFSAISSTFHAQNSKITYRLKSRNHCSLKTRCSLRHGAYDFVGLQTTVYSDDRKEKKAPLPDDFVVSIL